MSLCIRTNEMFHFPAADVSSMNFYAPSQGSTESDSCMIAIHTNVLEWLAVFGQEWPCYDENGNSFFASLVSSISFPSTL